MNPGMAAEQYHSFSHRAMNTIFEFIIYHEDRAYAEQAVWEVIKEVDRLEDELSRHRPNSDISKINSLRRGEVIRLSEDCYNCIKDCFDLYNKTEGAFNIACGPILQCWINSDKAQRNPTAIEIDRALKLSVLSNLILYDDYSAEVKEEGLVLDLGGYGKGYSVDRSCEILADWGIGRALISSGFSSIKTVGSPVDLDGWQVSISNPARVTQPLMIFSLNNYSISGSGMNKGNHIVDPITGRPVDNWGASWAFSRSAALSDALSTSFLVSGIRKTEEIVSSDADYSAVIVNREINLTKEHVHIFGHPPVYANLVAD